MLLTQAVAQEPEVGGGEEGGGGGGGVPPPLLEPLVKAWNTWVKAPLFWLTPLQVDEVVGYYSMLHTKPQGKVHVQVCTNISCLIDGGEELFQHASKTLGIGNQETTPDGQFSLEEVECMGACSWAPAIQLNYDFHHHVTPEKLDKLIADLRRKQ